MSKNVSKIFQNILETFLENHRDIILIYPTKRSKLLKYNELQTVINNEKRHFKLCPIAVSANAANVTRYKQTFAPNFRYRVRHSQLPVERSRILKFRLYFPKFMVRTNHGARIGNMARTLLGDTPEHAEIFLHGSFAETGAGHGTDKALVGGILGMKPDDLRIPFAFEEAEKAGFTFTFGTVELRDAHPNTAVIDLIGTVPVDLLGWR